MSTSLIGILTYRRLHALKTMLSGIDKHCPQYSCVVSEDCGNRDSTEDFMRAGRMPVPRNDLMADLYETPEVRPMNANDETPANYPNVKMLLGHRNLGVAKNSNKIIKYFMDGPWDHLCLCNDDLNVKGDFVKFYAQAHKDLGVGLLCFTDFAYDESYKWTTYKWRGYGIKFMPRFIGIMMSFSRELLEKVGYFDPEFGQFGEDHSDMTIRSRFAGGIRIEGQDMNCLDVEHELLSHQDVETSVVGPERKRANTEASKVMQRAAFEYKMRHYHRPYHLNYPVMASGYYGAGIPCRQLEQIGYKLAVSLV